MDFTLLYILIIMAALITPSIGLLLIIFTFFNWTGITRGIEMFFLPK